MNSKIGIISNNFCKLGSFAVFTMIGSFISLPLVQENQIDYSLLALFGSVIVGTIAFTSSAILDYTMTKDSILENIRIENLQNRKEPKIILN